METDIRVIADKIRLLQDSELDEILKAIIFQYSELLPAHKLVCLFLPKYDSEERNRILSRVERLCFPQTE